MSGRFKGERQNRQKASILYARAHTHLMSVSTFVKRSYIALGKGDVGKFSDDVIPLREIDQVSLCEWTRKRERGGTGKGGRRETEIEIEHKHPR